MPGFDVGSPAKHTKDGFTAGYLHVVAEAGDVVLGAAFRIPVKRPEDVTDADPGWFFIAPDLPPDLKASVADDLIGQSHRLMRDAGFTRVVTNMGTRAGAAFLRRHDL